MGDVNEDIPSNNKLVDMMLGRSSDKIVDVESMTKETQTRISSSLKQGFEYDHIIWVNEAADFLRKNVGSKVSLFVLFVDLVGSTKMTLELPAEKLSVIISSFSQEMGYVIKYHAGYLLKYVGDAVIAFFVGGQNPTQQADNVFSCARAMISVINKGINPILAEYGYPKLAIKVGIDFGENHIVRYGSNKLKAHVDILGAPISIASKIMAHAKPNEILIGNDVYEKIHPSVKTLFRKVMWPQDKWNYPDKQTGAPYRIFSYNM